MTDDARLRAIVADMAGIERAYVPTTDPWDNKSIAQIFTGSAEVERLLNPLVASDEVTRLAQIALEESQN